MLSKLHSHIKSVDSWESQIIVYFIRIHNLSSTNRILFYNKHIKTCSFSVYCC